MNYLHEVDLPDNFTQPTILAVDTETMGLNPNRDKLCLVQLSSGDNNAHLIQVGGQFGYKAPNLISLMKNKNILKVFHYARFDVAVIKKNLGVVPTPVFCTKIAS